LVSQTFGTVKKPASEYKVIDSRPLPYDFFKQGKLIFFQTINDHQQLDISINIPDIHKSLPDNPSLYLRLLLNKKGNNTLSDILKTKGLLTGFNVGIRRTYDGFTMFKINGYLTIEGIKNLDQVLKSIYQYLEYVKKSSLNADIYNFYRKALANKFQYSRKKKNVMDFMKSMCKNFWKYPKKYLFSQHSLLPSYDENKLKDFNRHLVINNSVILVGYSRFTPDFLEKYKVLVQGFDPNKLTFKQEDWYYTKYSTHQLSNNFMATLLNTPQNFNVNFLTERKKPLPNNISLVSLCKTTQSTRRQCVSNMLNDRVDLKPELLLKNNFVEFYHKLDRSFLISKVNLFVKFVFYKNVNDPKYATFLRLLISCLNHHFRNFFHEENIRQNKITLNASPK